MYIVCVRVPMFLLSLRLVLALVFLSVLYTRILRKLILFLTVGGVAKVREISVFHVCCYTQYQLACMRVLRVQLLVHPQLLSSERALPLTSTVSWRSCSRR